MVFELIHWAFAVLAVIYLVTESTLFVPLRLLLARGSWVRVGLLYCPACFGFWAGAALHVLWPYEHLPLVFGGVFDMGSLFHAVDSGLAALVLGAIWGKVMQSQTFDAERAALKLPGEAE